MQGYPSKISIFGTAKQITMSSTKKRLLLAVDFRDQSLVALEQAIDLARFIDAGILMLHVIDTGYFLARLFTEREHYERLKAEAMTKLNNLAGQYSASGILFETRVEEGKIYDKIIEVADEIHARFIVLGKNETKEGKRNIMGSNATHVISEAHVPVISVGGLKKSEFKKIVVPLDLTRRTRGQLFSAIAFALHYNATVHLVSVMIGGGSERKSLIMKKMKAAQKTFAENGISCTIKLYKKSNDPPYTKVLDYVKEVSADLIIVMTHQEERFENYIGAFAHHIINEADIPVMTLTCHAISDRETSELPPLIDPLGIFSETPRKKFLSLFKFRSRKG